MPFSSHAQVKVLSGIENGSIHQVSYLDFTKGNMPTQLRNGASTSENIKCFQAAIENDPTLKQIFSITEGMPVLDYELEAIPFKCNGKDLAFYPIMYKIDVSQFTPEQLKDLPGMNTSLLNKLSKAIVPEANAFGVYVAVAGGMIGAFVSGVAVGAILFYGSDDDPDTGDGSADADTGGTETEDGDDDDDDDDDEGDGYQSGPGGGDCPNGAPLC